MYNAKTRSQNISMKIISPNVILNNMRSTDEVVVNRISINIRILELQRAENPNLEALNILFNATKRINNIEHHRSGALFGAKMTIGEILTAFGREINIEKLPYNTFVEK